MGLLTSIGAQSPDTNGFTTGSIDTSGASLLVATVSWYTGVDASDVDIQAGLTT